MIVQIQSRHVSSFLPSSHLTSLAVLYHGCQHNSRRNLNHRYQYRLYKELNTKRNPLTLQSYGFFLLVMNACRNCQHTHKNEPPRLFLFIICIRYNKKRETDTCGFGFARVGDDACRQILVAYCNCECWQSAFNVVDATCDSDRRAQMKAHGTLRLHSHSHWQVLFGTQVRGFKPGRSRRILRAKKSSARLSSEGK
jgi:hypothetical protein